MTKTKTIENKYEKIENENDKTIKLVYKSACLQYDTTAIGHCICD